MSTLTGKGIHSGLTGTVTLHRTGGPVAFIRGKTRIPARVEHVQAVNRSTVLSKDGASIAMVEHILAALHVLGWWEGLDIEVSGAEMPILDGSAADWLEPLRSLGTPPAAPPAFRVGRGFEVELGAGLAVVEPGEAGLSVCIDFDHPAIGRQSWHSTPDGYADVLHARTFGLLSEQEQLQAAGLALGADLSNTLVFGESGPLSPQRYPDEPVRHKALDAIGDLYLFGRPVKASIRLTRASHGLHARLVAALRAAERARGLVS